MFVFIVVVWIFIFNKYMIQNPVFFVYNVIMISIVYAIVLSQVAQTHASRKRQRLIHERVTRCMTGGLTGCSSKILKFIPERCQCRRGSRIIFTPKRKILVKKCFF